METPILTLCALLWLFPLEGITAEESQLEVWLRTGETQKIVGSTTDQNRASRIQMLSEVLQNDANGAPFGNLRMPTTLMVLEAIDLSGSKLGQVKQVLDDSGLSDTVRENAVSCYFRLLERNQGHAGAVAGLAPYISNTVPAIADAASSMLAATNREDALAHLNERLQASIAALPQAGFTVNDNNRELYERQFGHVYLGMRVMRGMQLPGAQIKVQEAVAILRMRYPDGEGRAFVQKSEDELDL